MKSSWIMLGAACLAVACGQAGGEANNIATPANAATAAPPAVPAAPAAPAIESAYTPLDLAACQLLEAIPEGESASRRCPGFAGVPLFVDAGDGRFDVDAGVNNENFESLSNLNDVGDRVEWRHEGGRPFAIIYRLRNADAGRPPSSSLIVETMGRAGAPGCEVERVDGSLADANARARAIADTRARTHRCAG